MIFKKHKHSLLDVTVYTVVTYKTELAGKKGRNPELKGRSSQAGAGRQVGRQTVI
jgi:hypothetical protein